MDPLQVPVWLVLVSLFLHLLALIYVWSSERKISTLHKTERHLFDGVKAAQNDAQYWRLQFQAIHDWFGSLHRDIERAKSRAIDERQNGGNVTVPGGTVAEWLSRVNGIILWQKMHTGQIDLWRNHTWIRQQEGTLNVYGFRPYASGLRWLCHEARHPHTSGPLSLLPQGRSRAEVTEALLQLQKEYSRAQDAQEGLNILTLSDYSDEFVMAVRAGTISADLKALFAPHHQEIAAVRFYWGAGSHFNINLVAIACGKKPWDLDNAETARVHQVIEWMFDELLGSPSPA